MGDLHPQTRRVRVTMAQGITLEAVGRDKEPSPAWETVPTGQGELEKGNAWSEWSRNVVKTPCLEARGRVFQGEGCWLRVL